MGNIIYSKHKNASLCSCTNGEDFYAWFIVPTVHLDRHLVRTEINIFKHTSVKSNLPSSFINKTL